MSWKRFLVLLLLGSMWWLLTLMCVSLPTSTPAPPDRAAIATGVAATLNAMASGEPATGAETPIPGAPATVPPTDPPPTLTATPTARLWIVYTDAGQLMAIDTDRELRPLGSARDASKPLITQEGSRVIFARSVDATYPERQELWVINSDGSGERPLLTREQIESLHPREPGTSLGVYQLAQIPGRQALLFNTWILHEGPGLRVSRDLFYIDLDTGELVRLLDRGEAGFNFDISPDGRRIALLHPEAIDLARLEGTTLVDLRREVFTFPPVLTYSEYAFIPSTLWAPDSSALFAFIPPPDIMAPDPPPLRVWRIPLTGEPEVFSEVEVGEVSAYFSPDLQWVVYIAEDGPRFLARSDGSEIRPYSGGGPTWSPDSRFFAGLWDDSRVLSIGRVDGEPINIPLDDFAHGPIWVTGDTFLLWIGRGGAWRLVLGRVDGTLETLATSRSRVLPDLAVVPITP